MDKEYTGEDLRRLRRRAMLTQRQVVKLTGLAETTIVSAEKGTTSPHRETLEKLISLYAEKIPEVEAKFKILYRKVKVRRAPVAG